MLMERTRNKGFLIFFLLLLWCCSPEAKYKTLKIFFDGVPDPNATEEKKEAQPAQKPKPVIQPVSSIKSRHSDYKQKRCGRCHDTTSAIYLVAEKRKICFLCHKEVDFQGMFVHGPVAVGDCLPCHHPHESEHQKLLKAVGETLCYKCHKPDEVIASEVHIENKAADCSSCHLPHAAENRSLTKKLFP